MFSISFAFYIPAFVGITQFVLLVLQQSQIKKLRENRRKYMAKIIAIDDDKNWLNILTLILKNANHEVFPLESGEKIIEAIKSIKV